MKAALARLVAEASDGQVTADEALAGEATLPVLGVNSLAYLRLIDAVETEYGVSLDLDGDLSYLDTLDGLARHLTGQGVDG
jgi:acyl carrier protein